MGQIWLGALAMVTVFAQVSWLPLVRPLGVVPSAALVLVVLVALEGRAYAGLVLALVAGFVLDLVSGGNFGLWMGVLVLEVLVAALVRQAGIEIHGLLVPAVMVVAGTLLFDLIVLGSLVGVVSNWPIGQVMMQTLAEILLNLLVMVLLRPLIRRSVIPEVGM